MKRKKHARRRPLKVIGVNDGAFRKIATDICRDAISLWSSEWRQIMLSMMSDRVTQVMSSLISGVMDGIAKHEEAKKAVAGPVLGSGADKVARQHRAPARKATRKPLRKHRARAARR